MTTVVTRTPARAHGELTSALASVQRRYSYLVWPYGSQMAQVPCETLSKAMEDAARPGGWGHSGVGGAE